MQVLRNIVNGLFAKAGYRIVNSGWGPRGDFEALQSIRKCGMRLESIVDVGASNGVWTRECLKIFPEASYLLIDPLPQNQPCLKRMADEHENIQSWNGAAGSEDGTSKMRVHGDQSSFYRGEFGTDEVLEHQVEVRTLDGLLERLSYPQPDLIKADVQGHELEVLYGAEQSLRKCSMLLLECSVQEIYAGIPLVAEVLAGAYERGFQVYDVCTYAQRPLDGKLAQMDILLARADCKQLFSTGWQ